MASKKAGGSTRNGRDSEAKRLGVKAYGNELIPAGSTFLLDPNSDIPTLITEAMTTALSKPFGWLQGPIIGEVGESLEFDARG